MADPLTTDTPPPADAGTTDTAATDAATTDTAATDAATTDTATTDTAASAPQAAGGGSPSDVAYTLSGNPEGGVLILANGMAFTGVRKGDSIKVPAKLSGFEERRTGLIRS